VSRRRARKKDYTDSAGGPGKEKYPPLFAAEGPGKEKHPPLFAAEGPEKGKYSLLLTLERT